jgi:hypothetical protein
MHEKHEKPRSLVSSLMTAAAAVVVIVASLPACDALTGGKVAGSCDWRSTKGDRCFEYPSADMKKECSGGRVWKDGPCDRTGAICGVRMSTGIQKWIYDGAGTTKEKAMTECTQDGKLLGPDGKPK